MKVEELLEKMPVKVLAGEKGLSREIQGGYVGDLLSFVMAHAKENNIWITIQGHINAVAVASLVGLSAIILAEGVEAREEMIQKAEEENIPLLSTKLNSFEFITQFYELVK